MTDNIRYISYQYEHFYNLETKNVFHIDLPENQKLIYNRMPLLNEIVNLLDWGYE